MYKRVLFFLALLSIGSMSFSQDPWKIEVNNPLQGDYYGITSANGQIGIVSSRSPLKADKLVIGGLYDIYASARVNNYFPNINPLDIELSVDGDRCSRGNIDHYRQQFNYADARFMGDFDFRNKVHVEYSIFALRQMPYGFMMDVTVKALEDCELLVLNQHTAPEILRNSDDYISYIDNKANPFQKTYPHYVLMTTTAQSPTGRHHIACCSSFLFPDNPTGGTETEIRHRADRGVGRFTQEFDHSLKAGETLHFCLVGNIMADNVVPDTRNEVERLTVYQHLEGYDRLIARHRDAWKELWKSDIIIEGDAVAQQDVHGMLYHLYAFFREGNAWSCSPMGLSGLGYNGHNFWDTETWMFPALLLMHPQIAKEALQYRFDRLAQARQKAYFYGFKGALFPWESADSGQEEVAPNNMYPNTELHITGDIAIAAWQYYCVTQDKQWLASIGWPLIQETADFWVSRVDTDDSGKAHIRNVIGADEWSCNAQGGKQVDDNAYTLGVAITNLQIAAKAAKVLGCAAKPAWTKVASQIEFETMDNGVYKEHSTYHGEVTKQADVSLLAFPLHIVTDTALMRRNLEYYISKVPEKQTPAMSKSIYAVLYCRLNQPQKALFYFRDSYLPNLNPPFRVMAEFNGGTNPYFITGAGGTLQTMLFGFGGLDITDKGLRRIHKAQLPPEWKSVTLRVAGQEDIIIR